MLIRGERMCGVPLVSLFRVSSQPDSLKKGDENVCKVDNLRPGIPMFRSAFNNVDLPTLGIPTTKTLSSVDTCAFSLAMSVASHRP